MMSMRFHDRSEAGRLLASRLDAYAKRPDVVVLGLARGGVPVAYEIAMELGLPLDVLIVRKLGVPYQPELAMGAIASGGIRILNQDVIESLGIPSRVIESVAIDEQREIERREHLYRGARPAPRIRGNTVIVVDDGIATGASMRAAVAAIRQHVPTACVVAVPVASTEACDAIRSVSDECVCLVEAEYFLGVGAWYDKFPQVSDEEIHALLDGARLSGHDHPDVWI
jgi:putative phosphoribosyl transferase